MNGNRLGAFCALAGIMLFSVLVSPAECPAAAPDGNVEWDGISHVSRLDRRPICPVDGETFEVLFQTYGNDLTSARVRVEDGDGAWITASKISARGPYDVWSAQVPATEADQLSYYIELTDGGETDYLGAGWMSAGPPVGDMFTIDYATLEHAPVGATLLGGGGTVFKVWSPSSSTAHVRGEFNGWGLGNPMNKVGDHFIARVSNASDRQMYKFFFDGSHWNTDARARALDPGDNYNAVIEDPLRYEWQTEDFSPPPFEEMVVYQLHVGTFSGRNDPYGSTSFPAGYLDVAARASHLAELGVNAVMLNPITEFPWDYSAGYNPITAWAPESVYGDPDDFKAMIDALHAEGIAVLLDIVWNHVSYSDNYLWNYDGTQLYFDDPAVETPWGSQADFDDEGVRDYYAHSALMWLEEYRLDGFRMDATGYMNIAPQEASGWSLMQRLNDEMNNRCVDKIAIAEQLPDNSWVTRPTSLGGAGFDSQYNDAFTDRLREELFDAAYGDPEMWKISDIVGGSGSYLEHGYVTNYLELHDEAWPSSGGQRMVQSIDATSPHDDQWAKGRTKLGQGLVMTAPGIPAMLQGTEWLEDSDFGTDAENRIDWSKKTTYAGIFDYYKDLVALRTGNPALRSDAGLDIFHVNESVNVIAFQRYGGDEVLVVVANLGNSDYASYRVGLPQPGLWHEALNSQAPEYEGSGPVNPGDLTAEAIAYDGYAQSMAIALPKAGLVVLRKGSLVSVDGGVPGAGPARILGAHPNPFNPSTEIVFNLPAAGNARVRVFDISGRAVRTLADRDFDAGEHALPWNGRDDRGNAVASGVYLVRMDAGDRMSDTAKIVLLR
ncbi:MAG: alpha amylase C-terminal domain-containing protein [Candidatus Eisenbacteria bacterium]|nr:alpha amylase C-terminal domain-containing protein [Candidatus Eisenbacteria bacterium]